MSRNNFFLSIAVGTGFGVGLGLVALVPVMFSIGGYRPDVTAFQRCDLLIRLCAALFTLVAIFVALIREDVRRLWDSAHIGIECQTAGGFDEELEDSADADSGDSAIDPSRARRYHLPVALFNESQQVIKNCHITVNKISITRRGDSGPENAKVKVASIPLFEERAKSGTLVVGGRWVFSIFEVALPNIGKHPGENTPNAPLMRIGENELGCIDGKCVVELSILGENIKPYFLKLQVEWNGKWKHRKAEMSTCLKATLTGGSLASKLFPVREAD